MTYLLHIVICQKQVPAHVKLNTIISNFFPFNAYHFYKNIQLTR